MATEIQITDEGGSSFPAWMIGGRQYPNFPKASLENAFSFKARSDDIFLCAYPRSGTHWTYEILRFLIAGTTALPHVDKETGMLELESPSAIEDLPSPRILNTHYHFDNLSPDILRHRCKIVLVIRDPRDQMVSAYNQKRMRDYFNGQWNHFFNLVMEGKMNYGPWFDYIKGWEKGLRENPDYPVLVMTYEAMKKDPLSEVRRISEFLGLEHTEDFLLEIVTKTAFDAMKAKSVEMAKKATNENDRIQAEHGFRKGAVSDWKNWFTVAQSERFEEAFDRAMAGSNAHQLYSLKH